MADLSLNLNPALAGTPAYRDVIMVDGDLVLTQDVQAAGTNPVLQNILQRLRYFEGEWFLDNTQGVPWLQQIFVKNAQQGEIDAILQAQILKTPGVLALTAYAATRNAAKRTLNVSFTAQTTSGQVNYTTTLGVGLGAANV